MGEVKHGYQSWYGITEEGFYAGTVVDYDVTELTVGNFLTGSDVTTSHRAPSSTKFTIPDSNMERTPLKEIGAGLYLDDIIAQKVNYADGSIDAYIHDRQLLSGAMGVWNISIDAVPLYTAPGETPPSYEIHAYNTIESFDVFGCVIKDYTIDCKVDELVKQSISLLHHKTVNRAEMTVPTGIVYKATARLHFSDVVATIDGNTISDLFMKSFSLKITNEFHPTITLEDYYRRAPVLKARNIEMSVEFEADASQFQTERFAASPTEFNVDFDIGSAIDTTWTNMYVDSISWQELADPGEVYQYKMTLKNGVGFTYTDGNQPAE